MSRKPRPALACIGAGKLARTLLPALHAAGYPILAVASRRLASARQACRELPGARPTTRARRAAAGARAVLLAVPDRALEETARHLADEPGARWSGRVVLHHAGALGLEPLQPLRKRGASIGVLHPLQALGDPAVARTLLAGSHARIEGEPPASTMARRLSRDVGLIPFSLRDRPSTRDRSVYHAAASLVSNDLLALLAQAADLLESAGVPRRQATRALVGLASGTLQQIRSGDLRPALSGPVVRGDVATLQAQLRALDRRSKRAATLHRLLSARLLELVRETRHESAAPVRARMRALLRPGRRTGRTV